MSGRQAISDASVLVYPTRGDVVACARMLRDELRADYDTDPTDLRRVVTPAQAEAALATADSGEHRISIGPCPHARPGDPICDACLAVARGGR